MNSLQIDTSTCRLAKRFSAEYNYSESMHCFSVHVGKHPLVITIVQLQSRKAFKGQIVFRVRLKRAWGLGVSRATTGLRVGGLLDSRRNWCGGAKSAPSPTSGLI